MPALTDAHLAVMQALAGGHGTTHDIARVTHLTPWEVNACLSYPTGACSTVTALPRHLITGSLETWTRTRYALTGEGHAALQRALTRRTPQPGAAEA